MAIHHRCRLLVRPIRLETRIVPAIIQVNSTGDTVAVDGAVTLREAVNSMSAGAPANLDIAPFGMFGTNDTILFDPVVFGVPQTINMSGHYVLSKSMTITGPGS